jgi:hypothetical protein
MKFQYPGQYEAYQDVWEYLFDKRTTMRMIFLYRKNLLHQSISTFQRKAFYLQYGLHNWIKGSCTHVPRGVHVNTKQLFEILEFKEDHQRNLQALQQKFTHTCTIEYEDLITNTKETLQSVLSFLGADTMQLNSSILKISPTDIRESVLNYDEIERALRGTSYEHFL